jgi:hypothetical protein
MQQIGCEIGHVSICIVNEPLTSFNPWFTFFIKGYTKKWIKKDK